jgi:putative endonuclease
MQLQLQFGLACLRTVYAVHNRWCRRDERRSSRVECFYRHRFDDGSLNDSPYVAPMTAARQAFGELGERIAERWLKRHGWRVVQRRFRNGHRDIDLVVEQEGTVAFVEVKARRGVQFGDPVEAVNWSKQKELARSASVWIDRHGRPAESYRFDVVGVLVEGDRVRVRHVPNAFSLSRSA